MSRLPAIEPQPPLVSGHLPWVGAGFGLLRDPTAFFQQAREKHGDTYVVDAFGYRLLCVFSPEGVRNLWAVPEAQASKGLADYALLRHKVPDELFAGRRTFPHDLFRSDDTSTYLKNLEQAVEEQLDELGSSGEIELFDLTRRLGHRVGLASWGGVVGDCSHYLDRLIPALDRLDASDSFVHPHRGLIAVATRKRAAHRAIATLDETFGEIISKRQGQPADTNDLFSRICAKWDDVESPARGAGIARDVVLVHMGSQSNLFAAMAWTLIHFIERPELIEQARSDSSLIDRVAFESIRLRQRSIVLRQVLKTTELSDEKTTYRAGPGVFLATMMSVTNTTAGPGLDVFDPGNYRGPRFNRAGELSAKELVTTFGHGKHSCPAQVFSVSAIRHSVGRLLDRYSLVKRFRDPQPLRRQLGGVARADRPCRVAYRLR